jgi:hypothetical protein
VGGLHDATFYRLRISDRKTELVAMADFQHGLANATPAFWTGLAPDDSPLCLRDTTGSLGFGLRLGGIEIVFDCVRAAEAF